MGVLEIDHTSLFCVGWLSKKAAEAVKESEQNRAADPAAAAPEGGGTGIILSRAIGGGKREKESFQQEVWLLVTGQGGVLMMKGWRPGSQCIGLGTQHHCQSQAFECGAICPGERHLHASGCGMALPRCIQWSMISGEGSSGGGLKMPSLKARCTFAFFVLLHHT